MSVSWFVDVDSLKEAETIAETLRSDVMALERLRSAFILSANSSQILEDTVSAYLTLSWRC